ILQSVKKGSPAGAGWTEDAENEVLARLISSIKTPAQQAGRGMLIRLTRVAVAAAVVLCLTAAAFYYLWPGGDMQATASGDTRRDNNPATEKSHVVLTLADG